MAKGRPWYKRQPERWIMGTRGLTLEERGAYSEIVDYLNLRDHALPDDEKVMASLLGCPRQRWRKIRAVLIKAGKLTVQGDYITNPRFEREKAERELSTAEAVIHGREGGRKSAELRAQPELDLDAKPQQELKESSKKVATLLEKPKKSQTPVSQKTADKSQGYPQAPYARVRGIEDKSIDSTLPDSPSDSRLNDSDLMEKFEAVCDAAGFKPISPAAINRAISTVEAWISEGLDFEIVVIPTIRSIIANSNEGPTRVLSRFTPHLANETAKRKAKVANGQRYIPPKAPVLSREDEDPRMADLRGMLAQAMGPGPFALWFNELKLEPCDERPEVLHVTGRMSTPLMQSGTEPVLRAVARRFGYSQVFAR